jgi:membrane-bound serine protease (ClpP class)
METWLVGVLYVVGLGMMAAEALMPGVVMGIVGTLLVLVSVVMGWRLHWAVGAAQIALALVVGPAAFFYGLRRLAMNATLGEAESFGKDFSGYLGREGEAHTDLRPAGTAIIDGKKVDVVTAGEPVSRGRRVRVDKVEGNRVVVRGL